MLTIGAGLTAALFYALTDFLMVRVVRAAPVAAGLLWLVATGTLVIVPVALLRDGLPAGRLEWQAAAIAAAGGLLHMAALGALFRALTVGDLSIVSPVNALEGAFAGGASVIAGERLAPLALLALPVSVIGGVLCSVTPKSPVEAEAEAGGRLALARGVGWALVAAAAGGTTILVYGLTTALSPLSAVAMSRVASLLVIAPIACRRGWPSLPAGLRRWVVLAGLVEVAAFLALAVADWQGPVSVASVMTAQFAAFAVVLGVIVLGERPTRTQRAGIVATVVGVSLLALMS